MVRDHRQALCTCGGKHSGRKTPAAYLADLLATESIDFGYAVTVITLYLIPCALLLSEDMGKGVAPIRTWYFRPFDVAKR